MNTKIQIFLRFTIALVVAIVIIYVCLNITHHSTNRFIRFNQLYTISNLRTTSEAIKKYRQKHGALPRSLKQLGTDPEFSKFQKNGTLTDSWNRPLIYTVNKDTFVLMSYGQDNMSGGIGINCDLSNRDLNPAAAKISMKDVLTYPHMQGMLWASFGSGALAFLLVLIAIDPDDLDQRKWISVGLKFLLTLIATFILAMIITMAHYPSGH